VTSQRLRYVFEDPAQPPLDDTVPYPDVVTEQHKMGAYWRHQWGRPLALDAMALRLVVEGHKGHAPDVTVELDFDPSWTAIHRLVREHGTWMPSGEVVYQSSERNPPPLTERDKRRANFDRHRDRVEALIDEAIALDEAFTEGDRLWDVICFDWQLRDSRSRRGRKRRIDPDEVDRLMSEGMSVKDIARKFGVHEKTPYNALQRMRKRRTM